MDKLRRNTLYFRERMTQIGFAIAPGEHPIVPVMLGDARLAVRMAERMLEEGVYVIGFSYPVVPRTPPASASRFPPRSRLPTSTSPSTSSRKSARNSA